MKPRKLIILLTAMMILVYIISRCQSSPDSKGLSDGEYRYSYGALVLKGGHYTFGHPEVIEEGSYIVDGDRITFNTDTTSNLTMGFCGKAIAYTYQWSFDSKTRHLAFKVVDDTCEVRLSTFGSGFELQK